MLELTCPTCRVRFAAAVVGQKCCTAECAIRGGWRDEAMEVRVRLDRLLWEAQAGSGGPRKGILVKVYE